jgi:hypothetical protein
VSSKALVLAAPSKRTESAGIAFDWHRPAENYMPVPFAASFSAILETYECVGLL